MYQFCPDVRMSEEFSHVSWLFKRFGPVRWNILALRTDRAWISNLKNTAYYQKALCHTLTLPADVHTLT